MQTLEEELRQLRLEQVSSLTVAYTAQAEALSSLTWAPPPAPGPGPPPAAATGPADGAGKTQTKANNGGGWRLAGLF